MLQLSFNLRGKVALLNHVRVDVNTNIDIKNTELSIIIECPFVMDMATDIDNDIRITRCIINVAFRP